MTDHYTKGVLTVIAAALVALVVDRATAPVSAQGAACGQPSSPCAVTLVYYDKSEWKWKPCSDGGHACMFVINHPQ